MKVKSESEVAQSCPTLATPWTAAYQAPPSMGFSRQKNWSGVPLLLAKHKDIIRLLANGRKKKYSKDSLWDKGRKATDHIPVKHLGDEERKRKETALR